MSSAGFCAVFDPILTSPGDPKLSYCDDGCVISKADKTEDSKADLIDGLKKAGLEVRPDKCYTSNPSDENDPAREHCGAWKGGWKNVSLKVAEDHAGYMSKLYTLTIAAKTDPTLAIVLCTVSLFPQIHSYLTRNSFTDEQLDTINDASLVFIRSMLHLPQNIGWSTLMNSPTDGGMALRPFSNQRDECEERLCKLVCPGLMQGLVRPAKDTLEAYWRTTGRPVNYETPLGRLVHEADPTKKSPFGKFAPALIDNSTLLPYPTLVACAHVQLGLMALPAPYGSHVMTFNGEIRRCVQRFGLPEGLVPSYTLSVQTLYAMTHNALPPYIFKALSLAIKTSIANAALAKYAHFNTIFKGFTTPRYIIHPPPGFNGHLPPPPNFPPPPPPPPNFPPPPPPAPPLNADNFPPLLPHLHLPDSHLFMIGSVCPEGYVRNPYRPGYCVKIQPPPVARAASPLPHLPILPPEPPEIFIGEFPDPLAIPDADDPIPSPNQELEEPAETNNLNAGNSEAAPATPEHAPLLLQQNTTTHNNNNNNSSTSPVNNNSTETNNSFAGNQINVPVTSVTELTERLKNARSSIGRAHDNSSEGDRTLKGRKRSAPATSPSITRNETANTTRRETDNITDDAIVNERERERESDGEEKKRE
jgi:hypothetical protein